MLLGIKAVIVESFELIHRSNLVGMGVIPLEFQGGATRESLKLDGSELLDITGIEADIKRRKQSMGAGTKIDVRKENGESVARIGAGEANGVYDIVFVTFDKNHSTEVKRGENRGKTLVNARVVREYDMLGSWSGEPVNLRIPIAGRPGNSGCAILVQKREYGEIVAFVSLPFDSSGLSNNR